MPIPDHHLSHPTDLAALRAELSTLTTEAIDPELRHIDSMSTAELVSAMNRRDQTVAHAVGRETAAITSAVDAIVGRLRSGGRLIYVGAGTPGRLGVVDASECPPTFSTSPDQVIGLIAGGDTAIRSSVEGSEDRQASGASDLRSLDLGPADVVVGISASGRTPYVVGALEYANQLSATTIGLTCNRNSPIGSMADIAIEVVVGPEFIAGSTRLKAGTAQKLVLNMLSTLSMVQLGKTYGNVMVDLQLTNDKLQARAEQTIMTLTGLTAVEATQALDASAGSVKNALFMVLTGLSLDAARHGLTDHAGHLRSALHASALRSSSDASSTLAP